MQTDSACTHSGGVAVNQSVLDQIMHTVHAVHVGVHSTQDILCSSTGGFDYVWSVAFSWDHRMCTATKLAWFQGEWQCKRQTFGAGSSLPVQVPEGCQRIENRAFVLSSTANRVRQRLV